MKQYTLFRRKTIPGKHDALIIKNTELFWESIDESNSVETLLVLSAKRVGHYQIINLKKGSLIAELSIIEI